jgi:ATP-dependent RNA helicase DeaD
MPPAIHRIAQSYLTNPAEVKIKVKTTTADTIRQRYWLVSGLHKLDALTRILEAEPFDAVIIFVRTKTETVELADRLQARGYSAVALNGDIPQNVRERTIDQLKKGKIDVRLTVMNVLDRFAITDAQDSNFTTDGSQQNAQAALPNILMAWPCKL